MATPQAIQKTSLPPQALEKEYVYNLQQQVYFLELQGKLLREKMSESKQQKSRGVEANPLLDNQLDESLQLTELFSRLKQQFAQQNAENKKQIELLKADLDKQTMLCTEQRVQLKELQDYKENAQVILENRVSEMQKIIQNQQIQVEDSRLTMEKQRISADLLEKELSAVKKTNKEQSELVYTLNAQIQELQSQLEFERSNILSNDALQNQLSRAQADLHELKGKYQAAMTETTHLRDLMQARETELFTIRQNYDAAKVEAKNLQQQLTRLNEELQQNTKNLTAQRNLYEQLTNKCRMLEGKVEAFEQHKNATAELIAVFNDKRKMDQQTDKYEALNKLYMEQIQNNKVQAAALKQFELETAQLRSTIAKLQNKMTEDQQEVATKVGGFNAIVVLNQEQRSRIDELEKLQAERDDLVEKLQAKIEFLDSELATKEEISQLQLEEFDHLRKSNEALTQMLSSIQEKFSNLGRAGERLQDKNIRIPDAKKTAIAAVNAQKK